jgi:hypothetical protein
VQPSVRDVRHVGDVLETYWWGCHGGSPTLSLTTLVADTLSGWGASGLVCAEYSGVASPSLFVFFGVAFGQCPPVQDDGLPLLSDAARFFCQCGETRFIPPLEGLAEAMGSPLSSGYTVPSEWGGPLLWPLGPLARGSSSTCPMAALEWLFSQRPEHWQGKAFVF